MFTVALPFSSVTAPSIGVISPVLTSTIPIFAPLTACVFASITDCSHAPYHA